MGGLGKCYVWSIWLRNLDTEKIGEELFVGLLNLLVEENGEDKMVREKN